MNLWYLMKYILYFRFMAKKTKEKMKKWSINEDLCMYEEFPTHSSLLEYIREDKVMKLSLQRLKNKVQEGKREVKLRKEAKTKNYWKTRCSRHTFTILAISWAYELRLTSRSRPRKAKRKIYSFGFYDFLPKCIQLIGWMDYRSVRITCLIQPIGMVP